MNCQDNSGGRDGDVYGVAGLTLARRRAILTVLAIALILDGVDQQMLPLASPMLMSEWQLGYSQMGQALVSALVGMTLGTMAGGIAGDRFGKRRVVIFSTAAFALATLAIGLASSIVQVVALRFASGLAFGAIMPNAIAIAALLASPASRVKVIAFLVVCIPVGAMIGALAGSWLLPSLGWRLSFIVCGALPLGLAFGMIYLLPRFEPVKTADSSAGAALSAPASRKQRDGKTRFAGLDEILGPKTRQLTFAAWLMFFANGYGVYALSNWMPIILSDAGLSINEASNAIFGFTMAAIAGSYVATIAIGRMGTVISGILFMSAICVFLTILISIFYLYPNIIILIILNFMLCGLALGALQTTCYVFAYPEEAGATGIGLAVTFNRAGGMIAILLSGSILNFYGGNPIFFLSVILSLMFLINLIIIFMRRSLSTRHSALQS